MAPGRTLLQDRNYSDPGCALFLSHTGPCCAGGGWASSRLLIKIARNSNTAVGQAQAHAWCAARRTAHPGGMPTGEVQTARRLLVAAVKSVARAYRVSVDLTNTAPDAAVRSAYRRVLSLAEWSLMCNLLGSEPHVS